MCLGQSACPISSFSSREKQGIQLSVILDGGQTESFPRSLLPGGRSAVQGQGSSSEILFPTSAQTMNVDDRTDAGAWEARGQRESSQHHPIHPYSHPSIQPSADRVRKRMTYPLQVVSHTPGNSGYDLSGSRSGHLSAISDGSDVPQGDSGQPCFLPPGT